MSDPTTLLRQFLLGPMLNYIYWVGCAQTKEIAIVDPAWDVGHLLRESKKSGLTITAVLLTHGHADHIEGLEEFLKHCDVPVYLSAREADFYTPECKNLRRTADHETIPIGNVRVECLHTPGHTPGCQCYHADNFLLTGDVLFINGCGRCDLPGGDPRLMYDSLYRVIMKLPDTTVIYPGHHYGKSACATLAELKERNPYLTCKDLNEFLAERM